ncbi:MAG: hypothetical protein M1824_004171 [Vezdaea acicularis]|nr:MAG: hypothetical protein M1824_004171 [Vezdaea acicularis]
MQNSHLDYNYFAGPPQPYQFANLGLSDLPPTPTGTHGQQADNYPDGSPPEYEPFQSFTNPFPRSFDAHGHVLAEKEISHAPDLLDLHALNELQNNGAADNDIDSMQNQRSSSEEKEPLTPAQSRRKAQNRAAQRAFRERKERRVKDLESKLTNLETASSNLAGENQRLKQELHRLSTENEILKATSAHHHHRSTSTSSASNPTSTNSTSTNPSSSSSTSNRRTTPTPPPPVLGPMTYSPTQFYTSVLSSHSNKVPTHRITISELTGERLLDAGAAWDLIHAHPLFGKGLIDVADVCERLKIKATCDGQGPVFQEGDVKEAIEACAKGGGDELI